MTIKALGIVVGKTKYRIPVSGGTVALRDLAENAVVRHINKTFKIPKEDGRKMIENRLIEIEDIFSDKGCLDLEDCIDDCVVDEDEVLIVTLSNASLNVLNLEFSAGSESPRNLSQDSTSCSDQANEETVGKKTENNAMEDKPTHTVNSVPSEIGSLTQKRLSGSYSFGATRLPHQNAKPLSRRSLSADSNFSGCTQFSKHQILEATHNFADANKIGEGGQAVVYKGILLGTPVAIKRFQARKVADMAHEIQVLSTIKHPNVLLLMGVCEDQNCLVSELLSGGSLKQRLKDPSNLLTWHERRRIAAAVVMALLSLHDKKILHRDLKPANILLDEFGNVKVADMGVSTVFETTLSFEEGQEFTNLKGTPGYIDPASRATGKIDFRYDIYSLGLVILQLCTNVHSVSAIHDILGDDRAKSDKLFFNLKQHLVPFDFTLSEDACLDMAVVGIKCIRKEASNRPSLLEILQAVSEVEGSSVTEKEEGRPLRPRRIPSVSEESLLFMETKSQGTSNQEETKYKLHKSMKHLLIDTVDESKEMTMTSSTVDTEETTQDIIPLCELREAFLSGKDKREADKAKQTLVIQAGYHSASQYFLGQCYLKGWGFEVNFFEAYRLFKASSHRKDKEEDYAETMALLFESVFNAWRNASVLQVRLQRRLFDLLIEGANDGVAAAAMVLGEYFLDRRDHSKSIKYLHIAAMAGQHQAVAKKKEVIDFLRAALSSNAPKTGSQGKFLEALKTAANLGAPEAKLLLANIYFEGRAVERNLLEAVDWYRKADDDNIPEASSTLGMLHYMGTGVKSVDERTAFDLFLKAAMAGYGVGQWNLALCYENGSGVEKNRDLALLWMEKAAESGNAMAQEGLAMRRAKFSSPQVFSWSIRNFSSVSQSQVASPSFPSFNFNWNLVAFPHGNGNRGTHLSVYLHLEDAEQEKNVTCHFTLSVLNRFDPRKSRRLENYGTFKSNTSQGCVCHTAISEIIEEGSGFLLEDVLKFEVTIRVLL